MSTLEANLWDERPLADFCPAVIVGTTVVRLHEYVEAVLR